MTTLFLPSRIVLRAALWTCCALLLAGSVNAAQTQTPATPASSASQPASKNVRISVTFQKIDADGNLLLKYGSVPLKAKWAGIKLRAGAGGVLGILLPEGVRLQAEVVSKGAVQSVILWKNNINLNEQLLIQGVAEGVH